MGSVVIFAPSPSLTVTVEDQSGAADIHLHAGGQGVWQARMLIRLGAAVTLCSVFTGESGRVARHLLEDDGVTVAGVDRHGRGAAYVHDRRKGDREVIAETGGDPLSRHEIDELYGLVLREGMSADVVILSGPSSDDALPADSYRRLAADLSTAGATVLVDLAGERLNAALEGGVSMVKISDEELIADGRAADTSDEEVISAVRSLQAEGAGRVIVTREDRPILVADGEELTQLTVPKLEVADHRGAGDSLMAGTTAGLAEGRDFVDAVLWGAASGTLNVTRHGLGTGDAQTVASIQELITVAPYGDPAGGGGGGGERIAPSSISEAVAPDELARRSTT